MKRALALIALFSLALAGTIEVKQAESLSLFLGGSLVVLEGRPVILVRDGQTLSARRVIYDRKARRLTLSGQVRYTDDQGRTIEAEELVLFVGDESLVATNVKVRSGDFDFESPFAYRSQGQITMRAAYFSPCLAKGQNPPDYAFFAQQVTLFPGDRIVARGVWVSLFGQKELYLPVLVIFTGKRAPRVYLGQSAVDGIVAGADLPYVTKNGLGFTLLRYFEKRGVGVGLDHWGAGSAYEHYRFLYLPPEPGKDRGTLSLSLEYRKEEEGWSGRFSLARDDVVVPGRFTLSAEVKKTDPDDPFVRFSIERILDTDPAAPPPWGLFKGPEVEVAYRKARRLGDLTISGRAIVGGYEGESNPLNRSARREGPRIGAGRVYLEHHERYAPRLGSGLAFRLQNDFVGYYYSTAERQINWRTTARLSRRLGSFELGANLERWVREGETPFIFDRIPTRRTIELSPYLRYRQNPLTLSISGGMVVRPKRPPSPQRGSVAAHGGSCRQDPGRAAARTNRRSPQRPDHLRASAGLVRGAIWLPAGRRPLRPPRPQLQLRPPRRQRLPRPPLRPQLGTGRRQPGRVPLPAGKLLAKPGRALRPPVRSALGKRPARPRPLAAQPHPQLRRARR